MDSFIQGDRFIMKVLFSPSETKTRFTCHPKLNEKSFVFPLLYAKRMEVLAHYNTFIQKASLPMLQKLFGLKEEDKINELCLHPITSLLTCKAIERYDGVAYDYLSYQTLDAVSQAWIDKNVMIFSNLFGPLLAEDLIPYYKLQQGEHLAAFRPELFYKEHFSASIDHWAEGELILDLRAGFYEKFYTLKQPYITMKFLKKGKAMSHFAKAYRGKVLRAIAREQPSNEEMLSKIAFDDLRICEIKQSTYKREYVYDIID